MYPMLMLVAFAFAGSTPSIVPFPVRATDAVSGTTFAEQIADLPDHERYAATRDALLSGNVPSFLRSLVPVTLVGGPSAAATTITVFVTRDYLSVGGDDDFVPMPLDFVGAAEVANALGFGLPTRRIVDAIYNAADVQGTPAPLPAGPEMRSIPYILESRARIVAEIGASHIGALWAGTKKDLVITPQLQAQPDREAIYGWHQQNGRPIQPLSLVHGVHYADYSHGIRLVADTVLVNGEPRSYFDVLADPALAACLSDEGPIPQARAFIATAANADG
jgi:hypothetical protein